MGSCTHMVDENEHFRVYEYMRNAFSLLVLSILLHADASGRVELLQQKRSILAIVCSKVCVYKLTSKRADVLVVVCRIPRVLAKLQNFTIHQVTTNEICLVEYDLHTRTTTWPSILTTWDEAGERLWNWVNCTLEYAKVFLVPGVMVVEVEKQENKEVQRSLITTLNKLCLRKQVEGPTLRRSKRLLNHSSNVGVQERKK